jgi:hypothetical protein
MFSIILFKTSSQANDTSLILHHLTPLPRPWSMHTPLRLLKLVRYNHMYLPSILINRFTKAQDHYVAYYSNVVERTFHTSSTSIPRFRYTISVHIWCVKKLTRNQRCVAMRVKQSLNGLDIYVRITLVVAGRLGINTTKKLHGPHMVLVVIMSHFARSSHSQGVGPRLLRFTVVKYGRRCIISIYKIPLRKLPSCFIVQCVCHIARSQVSRAASCLLGKSTCKEIRNSSCWIVKNCRPDVPPHIFAFKKEY